MAKFSESDAQLVKEVGAISIDVFKELFHEFVTQQIKGFDPNDPIDPSLLRKLCNYLECGLKKKHIVEGKVNKKQFVIDEYIRLKPSANTEANKKLLDKLIEDFHNTGQIRKIPYKRYIKRFLKFILERLVK